MFAVTLGALNLGTCGPYIRAIQEGRVAGALAFDIIDHVPKVNSREKGKKKISKETLKGEIKFNNINFTYPLRPDL
jgi:ATP-binding cassette subfamily B (MDR/TAP) protein 1